MEFISSTITTTAVAAIYVIYSRYQRICSGNAAAVAVRICCGTPNRSTRPLAIEPPPMQGSHHATAW